MQIYRWAKNFLLFNIGILLVYPISIILKPLSRPLEQTKDSPQGELVLWTTLVNLFFLDIEHSELEIQNSLEKLKSEGISLDKLYFVLLYEVIPAYASKVGYFISPMIAGEWEYYSKEEIEPEIQAWLSSNAYQSIKNNYLFRKYYELWAGNFALMLGWKNVKKQFLKD